ncbi:MAG: hypothetical protein KatS3mg009_0549 [Acidimicrobiia bacterium]|nr:MAG: hypothetical protein KatS3mg009_0549 [Acidimicrobiia bacterium]
MQEHEVERQVHLVALAVEGGELLRLEHVRLADEDARRVVLLADPAPPAQHVVHLGTGRVVGLPLAPELHVPVVVRRGGRVVAQLAVLDDLVGDVEPEPRDAAVVPEPEDPVERVAHLLVPPVEVGLRREEVVQVVLPRVLVVGPGAAAGVEGVHPVVRRAAAGGGIRPHVPVAVPGVARRAGVDEPRVAVTRVVGHEVEDHLDPPPRRLLDQLVGVGEGAERGVDVGVVADVVPPVVVRRHRDRVEPDALDAEPLEVVEAVDDSPQVAHAVAVRVHVGTGIDLVQDPVAPPRAPGPVGRRLHRADTRTGRHGAARQLAAAVGAPSADAHSRAYRPPRATSSSWVPSSTTRPWSTTTIRSASRAVCSRCAISTVVRPRAATPIARCTRASVARSRFEVASSSSRIAGSTRWARASAMSCRCPDDSDRPRSLTGCR